MRNLSSAELHARSCPSCGRPAKRWSIACTHHHGCSRERLRHPVNVSLSGLPAGVTASPSTLSVAPGQLGQFMLTASTRGSDIDDRHGHGHGELNLPYGHDLPLDYARRYSRLHHHRGARLHRPAERRFGADIHHHRRCGQWLHRLRKYLAERSSRRRDRRTVHALGRSRPAWSVRTQCLNHGSADISRHDHRYRLGRLAFSYSDGFAFGHACRCSGLHHHGRAELHMPCQGGGSGRCFP